jgi:hypothetical protein
MQGKLPLQRSISDVLDNPAEMVELVLCYARGQSSVTRLEHGVLVLRACDTLRNTRSFAPEQIDASQK